MQALQIGDCLGLWGDAEAPGNAADAGRSRIPGLARSPAAEAFLAGRCASPLPPLMQTCCSVSNEKLRVCAHQHTAWPKHSAT